VYVLDTNLVSYYLRDASNSLLRQRILATPPEQLFITAITVEEILSGALSQIQRFRQRPEVVNAYACLLELLQVLQVFQVLPYTFEAERIFQTLPLQSRRVGTQDCRIAATACARGYILLTANVADFQKIGIVEIADWTV
jgi:predicted nucleic acid-binding protein